ncbi:hypothetical protein [Thiocystis violacea]|uniref:hypothetical protein n=1 Tax=Thiocystis violacea TaxID=13725 RepID=UPI0019046F08|nr:hypothetical protein [Thiocystis violacea]MBK1723384.1 hypothetical protein [Thiocystis violacea]
MTQLTFVDDTIWVDGPSWGADIVDLPVEEAWALFDGWLRAQHAERDRATAVLERRSRLRLVPREGAI